MTTTMARTLATLPDTPASSMTKVYGWLPRPTVTHKAQPTGVILRSERTGLRYGETSSRTEKGTAVAVQHQGYCPTALAGAAIVRGNVMTIDGDGKFISAPSIPVVAADANAAAVLAGLVSLISSINTERRLMVTAIAVEAAGAENDFLSIFLV